MRKLTLLFVITVALAAHASSAGAYSFEVSPGGEVEAPSEGLMTFESGASGPRCGITLTGTIASSGAIAAGNHFGAITGVLIEGCEEGSISGMLNLPWNITIEAILGSLPSSMTGLLLTIENWSILFGIFSGFISCLYQGNPGFLLELENLSANTYSTGRALWLEEIQLPKHSGSILCPESIGFAGELYFQPLQTIVVF